MKFKRTHLLKAITTWCVSICMVSLLHAQRNIPALYPAGMPVNFVRTWDVTAPIQDANLIISRPLRDVKMATQYLDGLGRLLQTVIKEGSLKTGIGEIATDLVSPVLYDEFGREAVKYMPYAEASLNNGLFKNNPFAAQATFYNNQLSGQALETNVNSTGPNWAYSKTNFEPSPLNRVNETYAPGNNWVGSETNPDAAQRRSVQMKYFINTQVDAVRIWKVDNGALGSFGSYAINTAINSGIYPAGELYKNVSIDEHKKQVIEFKDKEGKVILKKVQLTAIADDGTGRDNTGWLCTYYIYDDLNNLRCVIQPRGVELISPNFVLTDATILGEQCFRYEYDHRNRMIMKKVPGAGEVYMVYDKRDRLVLTQDANMRVAPAKWMLTKYDLLNRPIESGLVTNSAGFASHQAATAALIDYMPTGNYEVLTVSHYDDYAGLPQGLSAYLSTWNNTSFFDNTDNSNWPYPQMPTQSSATKGMVTWMQTKVLGTATFLNTVNYYDDKGRVIQMQSTNITEGTDVVTTQYSWAGQPLVMVQKQDKAGINAQNHVIITKMHYDDLGRVLNIRKTINSTINSVAVSKPEQIIVQNEYDKLGQLKKKKLGSNNLETLTYDYNIRGWLLGANRDYAKDAVSNNYFGFDLGYDKINNSIIGGQSYSDPQYNGNIEGMVWKSKGDGEKRKYDFAYDAANRLLKADFTQYTGGAFNQNALVNFDMKMGDGINVNTAYDANGNIKRMQQWSLLLNTSAQIDDLTYAYMGKTNKIIRMADAVSGDNKLGDYTDRFFSVSEYGYDLNGNMITDRNKGLWGPSGNNLTSAGAIIYNYLNLPETVNVITDPNITPNIEKGKIKYTYTAIGEKLQKIVEEKNVNVSFNGNNYTTDINTGTLYFSGGIVYEFKTYSNAALSTLHKFELQFTGHEEGRIRALYNNTTSPHTITGFAFDYMLKDHLGNVRMVLTEEEKSDPYPALSFEGAAGSSEVNNQNAIWEKADGTGFDVVAKRTTVSQLVNATNLQPPTLNNSLLVRSSTGKIGAGKLLKVMSGDKINTTVQYYFSQNTENGSASGLNTLMNSLASILLNSIGSSPIIKSNAVDASNPVGIDQNVINFFNPQNSGNNNGRPKAFLNVLFFDEQFKFDASSSYSEQISTTNPGQIIIGLGSARQAKKNGYCYIYISNETNDMVYFDNFTLLHERSSLIEETHYYPFGLTMAGISSKAAGGIENKNKYNGIEFNNDLDLNLYETPLRGLDPQVGRWWQVDPLTDKMEMWSPYTSNYDNPIRYADPRGDEPGDCCWDEIKNVFSTVKDALVQTYHSDVAWVNKTANKLANNARTNWANENTMPQQFIKEAMANPLSLMGGVEVKGAARLLGMEISAAERSVISLDNNALISAIEKGGKSAVKNAIGADKPIVSITAAKEYLVKGDKGALKNFMSEIGATVSKNGASTSQIKTIQSAAEGLGRKVGRNDASIIGGAVNNKASILTNDKQMGNYLKSIGWPVKSY